MISTSSLTDTMSTTSSPLHEIAERPKLLGNIIIKVACTEGCLVFCWKQETADPDPMWRVDRRQVFSSAEYGRPQVGCHRGGSLPHRSPKRRKKDPVRSGNTPGRGWHHHCPTSLEVCRRGPINLSDFRRYWCFCFATASLPNGRTGSATDYGIPKQRKGDTGHQVDTGKA